MIKIKGVNGNLLVMFDTAPFDDLYRELSEKIQSNQQLFKGSRVVFSGSGLTNLSLDEIAALQQLCLNYGMVLNNTELPVRKSSGTAASPSAPRSTPSSGDLFIHKNLRSGQKVNSEGTVVVWGDVHESAEIIAGRDIIVLGKMGGIAHAGCFGDTTSIVFALNLVPSQIRIADRISRSPEGQSTRPYPEVAYIDDEGICIKMYNPRENLGRGRK
ncbi:MAG TPA: septum site-determining protein MinC [Syntrophomonadaceae bacterium]|nr:septum site-determining protein MinC [Syntrophomonadaceae bacterium]HQA08520.1 septum site-determining protein MinC [Syntrophomonadaceae bacterium]HQE24237.1 septum site-determining protein MinC [Syntrophomonadaceae bacterium]